VWDKLARMKIVELLITYPYIVDFLSVFPDYQSISRYTLEEYFAAIDEDTLLDMGMDRDKLIGQFVSFVLQMEQLKKEEAPIESVTIIGGYDKAGKAENLALTIHTGEIICIVGPTGSGKSRLLADIEWMAQQDTPTRRKILINGQIPDTKRRFSAEHKLVAQLSQNMNFIMDLTVEQFVSMHAESRMMENIREVTEKIIAKANALAGERFLPETPVTALSGGQSRALMIADTAYLSSSPIVLIDEIENAGIDRKKALRLLADKQKIVLMATHDPILALMGDKRLVIKNGKIHRILQTTEQERRNLIVLEKMDLRLTAIRETLRSGGRIDSIPAEADVTLC
jgi:ABC-type lipoprotein export system ATPase subunit